MSRRIIQDLCSYCPPRQPPGPQEGHDKWPRGDCDCMSCLATKAHKKSWRETVGTLLLGVLCIGIILAATVCHNPAEPEPDPWVGDWYGSVEYVQGDAVVEVQAHVNFEQGDRCFMEMHISDSMFGNTTATSTQCVYRTRLPENMHLIMAVIFVVTWDQDPTGSSHTATASYTFLGMGEWEVLMMGGVFFYRAVETQESVGVEALNALVPTGGTPLY